MIAIDCFSSQEPELSLTEISKKIELSPSSASRLLETLVQHHFLYRDPKSLRYSLGFRLAQLGNITAENMDLASLARPILAEFNREFDESVGVYTLKEDYRICSCRIESSKLMRGVFSIGTIRPLTRGASGRAILEPVFTISNDRLDGPLAALRR